MLHTTTTQLFRSLMLAFTIMLFFAACKSADPGPAGSAGATGAVGPAGPAGPAGSPGAVGATGNANVIQISYGARSWANTTGATVELNMAGINADFATKSAFFTYISTGSLWYPVPGEVSSYGEFRTYVTPAATSSLLIKRVTAGSTLNGTAIRVVLIPASDIRNGGRKAAVDMNDYAAVKAFYNLPD